MKKKYVEKQCWGQSSMIGLIKNDKSCRLFADYFCFYGLCILDQVCVHIQQEQSYIGRNEKHGTANAQQWSNTMKQPSEEIQKLMNEMNELTKYDSSFTTDEQIGFLMIKRMDRLIAAIKEPSPHYTAIVPVKKWVENIH